jgi:DNA-binding NtrC family response regulator
MDTILLATQNAQTQDTFRRAKATNSSIHVVTSPNDLWKSLSSRPCDCLFIDLSEMEELAAGLESEEHPHVLIEHIRQLRPMIGIVIIAANADIRRAVAYVKHGASTYITEPVNADEMRLVVDEIFRERRQQSELAYLRERFWKEDTRDHVRTDSPLMQKVIDNVRSVAPTKATVLLLGETGTGKSFTARMIHRLSNRKEGPFICVHCGAIPDTLIESELFGHEKGAFTGAHRRKPGKFELACGGTIFLDEIGTVTPPAQVKLLTVLQEGTYQRVGGETDQKADVRVIAASNGDLKQMCMEGLFRKDLYYRLNVFPITIPHLFERKEDIPPFVDFFVQRFNQFNAKQIRGVHPDVMQALMKYDWPGNLRELENLLERAHILETTNELTPESFPSELFESIEPVAEIAIDTSETLAAVRSKALAEIERRYLKEVLSRKKGKINASAAEAGISTRQLNKLMHKHQLEKSSFKSKSSQPASPKTEP